MRGAVFYMAPSVLFAVSAYPIKVAVYLSHESMQTHLHMNVNLTTSALTATYNQEQSQEKAIIITNQMLS